MKKYIKQAIHLVGYTLSFLCPPALLRAARSLRDSLYTGYICRRFAKLGDSSFIWKPLNLQGAQYMHIGDGNIFEADLQMTARKSSDKAPLLTIGNNCLFRHGCHITVAHRITIGDNLLTGTNVLITDNSHGDIDLATLALPPRERRVVARGDVTIGNNVWLGNNVCIMPGITIGDSVIVGANSVVTHDLPPRCVAVGAPAKIIQQTD